MTPDWLPAARTGVPALSSVHARVIDGLGHPPVEDGFVLVEEGRIAAMDLEGRTLMPGLIDCHAHLVYGGFRNLEEIDRCPVETAAIEAVLNARTVLRAGYTTVRDLGTIGNVAVALRNAVAAGQVPGPRVVAAGRRRHPPGSGQAPARAAGGPRRGQDAGRRRARVTVLAPPPRSGAPVGGRPREVR